MVIQQPPQTAPWIGVNPYVVAKTISLNNPTTTQNVTVTNGGTGTFSWTAAENPDVTWLSLTNASGNPNGQFTMNFNVTGLAVGTYTTTVRVTATGAANTPLDIPVRVQVTPVPDTTPPAAITTLAASSPTDTTVTLTWTAPGDDGNTGTATTYDIRYSTSTINDGNWASATQVNNEVVPAAAGTIQSMVITGLSPTTTYYFAMKTGDEVPNWSGLSNVVSATTTVAMQGPIIVKHIGSNTSGWRGAYNVSSSYCWLDNWPNSNADATIAEFDRTALQTAINTIYSAYGGWDAQIVVSQVNWNTTQPPTGMGLVAGSADLDAGTVVWESGNAYGAGNGSWTFNGTGYGDFATAVNAGTASGRTVVVNNVPYTSVWDTSLPSPCWDVVMDVPESLINAYLQNNTALGLFASRNDYDGAQHPRQRTVVPPGEHSRGRPAAASDGPLDRPEHLSRQQDDRLDEPDGQPGRQRHQRRDGDLELDGDGQPVRRLDEHHQRLGYQQRVVYRQLQRHRPDGWQHLHDDDPGGRYRRGQHPAGRSTSA